MEHFEQGLTKVLTWADSEIQKAHVGSAAGPGLSYFPPAGLKTAFPNIFDFFAFGACLWHWGS